MTVTLLLIMGLLFQASSFTLSNQLGCSADALKANKLPVFQSEVTDFNDDVYEMGASVVWATNAGSQSLYEVILLKGGNTYKAHAIGSDLSVYNQTYTAPNPTQFLQVLEHIIFVKEFSADMQTFNFAAYLFDTTDVSSTALKRIQIDPIVYASGDKQFGLQFNKLLQYDDQTNKLYVVMTNSHYTQIQVKTLTSSGPFQSVVSVADAHVDIRVGNHKLMFDNSVQNFYKFNNDGGSYDKLPLKTAAGGSEFGPVLSQNFQFFKLMRGNFAITSYTGAEGSISASYGIFDSNYMLTSGEDLAGTGSFAPVIHYNKYNFVFISENIFSFSRYNSKLLFSDQEVSTLTAAQLIEAKNDFKNAFRVSFNVQKQFILTQSKIIIYELSYNTAGSQIANMNKLAEFKLNSDISDMIKDDTSKWIKLKIKCSCAKVLVTKLKCFSNKFKCLGINSYIPEDCTAPYLDTVPEFA